MTILCDLYIENFLFQTHPVHLLNIKRFERSVYDTDFGTIDEFVSQVYMLKNIPD